MSDAAAAATEELASRPARTLRFSPDRSVGMVMVSDGSPVPPPPKPALGNVDVPAGCAAVLVLDGQGSPDPSLLEGLGADDIDMIMNIPADDAWLAAASRLTSVQSVMTQGEVTDVGLEYLGKLKELSMLVITVGASVTADGIRHLAALPKLARLIVAGPVTLDLLKPLAEAERLGGLQTPGADAATLDGLRDLFPDMPIGGVWLSPKARRRLQAKKTKGAASA